MGDRIHSESLLHQSTTIALEDVIKNPLAQLRKKGQQFLISSGTGRLYSPHSNNISQVLKKRTLSPGFLDGLSFMDFINDPR